MPLITAAIVLGLQTQTPVQVLAPKVAMGVRPVAMAPAPSCSQVVVALEDGSVRILDASTRQTVRNLAKHLQPAYALDWSSDGAWIASGDETARVWIEDARNGAKVREYRTHTRGIQKASFNPSRTLLATTGKDDFIKVYNLSDTKPKELTSIPGNGANFYGATFHPGLPGFLTTGILGPGGRNYDARSGNVSGFLTDPTGQGSFDVAYNPAGTRAVSAGRDGKAVLWDPVKQQLIGKFVGHGDWVVYAAYSPNGRLVATGSSDRTVRVWDATNFKTVATIENQSFVGSPVAFTGDGKFLLTVNDAGDLQVNPLQPAQAGSKSAAPAKKAPVKKAPVKKATTKKKAPVKRRK